MGSYANSMWFEGCREDGRMGGTIVLRGLPKEREKEERESLPKHEQVFWKLRKLTLFGVYAAHAMLLEAAFLRSIGGVLHAANPDPLMPESAADESALSDQASIDKAFQNWSDQQLESLSYDTLLAVSPALLFDPPPVMQPSDLFSRFCMYCLRTLAANN